MKINGNGKSIAMWLMSIIVAGAVGLLLANWSGISGQALQTGNRAKEMAIQNKQDIAVINERLHSIEEKLDRIYNVIIKEKS